MAWVALSLSACGACRRPEAPPPDALAAQRAELASREAELDRRGADIARREQAVEAREQALTARDGAAAATGSRAAAVAEPTPGRRAEPMHGREEAALRHRRALDEMQAKGLLPADLPPEAALLDRQVYAALGRGDFDRAFDLSEELGHAIAAVEVNQRFLDAKLKRIAALRQKRQVDAHASAEVDSLLQEATSLVADGQYGSANGRINRIAAMLQ